MYISRIPPHLVSATCLPVCACLLKPLWKLCLMPRMLCCPPWLDVRRSRRSCARCWSSMGRLGGCTWRQKVRLAPHTCHNQMSSAVAPLGLLLALVLQPTYARLWGRH